MTTIIEADRALVDTFQTVLGEGSSVLVSLDLAHRHLEQHGQEYAVVLGPSVDLTSACSFADEVRVARPTLSVILVRRRIDTLVLSEALRAGMREVVEERDFTGLGNAAHRAYSLWQAMTNRGEGGPPGRRGQLVTVFGNKGGVGKSVLATNLAAAIADDARRACVVDLDVSCGDVAIMMQLFPSRTLADLGDLEHSLNPASIESLMTTHSENLSVLAAPMQPHSKDQISADAVGRVLQLLVTMYEVVVVDTSGAFDDFSLQAFDHSDLVLLIGTLDIPSLKNLKLAVETLDLLNIPRSRWRLVLNRADSRVGLSIEEVEQTLKLPIAQAIPSSRDVPASVNRGEPIVRVEPRHAVSQSIRHLARTLRLPEPAGDPSAAGSAVQRRRLLRRKVR
jgi:pilus assembly protein CpaE